MSDEALSPFETQIKEFYNQMGEGKNPFAPVSDDKLQEMYALAYILFNAQQYQEASLFFRLLVTVRPRDAKYWKGLGACFQMLKDYEEALNCYVCSQVNNREQRDPYLYVHAADCYFALKERQAGLKALEAAQLSAEERNDQKVIQHVAFMRQFWSHE